MEKILSEKNAKDGLYCPSCGKMWDGINCTNPDCPSKKGKTTKQIEKP